MSGITSWSVDRDLARESKKLLCAPKRQRVSVKLVPQRENRFRPTKRIEAVVSVDLWLSARDMAQSEGITLSKLISDALRAHVFTLLAEGKGG